MTDEWWLVAGVLVVLAGVLVVGDRMEGPVAGWWVGALARCGAWAWVLTPLLHIVGLAAYGGVCAVGWEFGRPLLTYVSATAIYGPLVSSGVPTPYSYDDWRRALEGAGASRSLARAIAWSGGPFAIVGMVTALVVPFETLVL